MASHPLRAILDKYTDMEVARALMRLLYQQYDAGGISMGRSFRSGVLETAMGLVGQTPRELAELSDDQPREFLLACMDLESERRRERIKKDDEEMFAREARERGENP